MKEHKFNVFGRIMAIVSTGTGWTVFHLGPDGKRRPAELVVPDFVAEYELCQYLADIFHEAATPTNGDVRQIQ